MIRLIFSQPSSGIPYVNTDFTSVLQDEHIKAYSSILDGINQGSTSSLEPRNSGIVLSGCDILSHNGSQFIMGFTNSVAYFQGEFYQNFPGFVGSITINDPFYIYPGPTTSELRTLPVDQVTTTTASHTRYFTYSVSQPASGPYIKFSNVGTSRYYKTVLKYFTSREGDIYMTKSLDNFNLQNGLGFNQMQGFVILGSTTSNLSGNPQFEGRFLRCVPNIQSNPGSLGGTYSHFILKGEFEHTHLVSSPKWKSDWNNSSIPLEDFNGEHYHFINTARRVIDANGQPISQTLYSGVGNPDLPHLRINNNKLGPFFGNENTGSILSAAWEPEETTNNIEISLTGGVHDISNSELQNHTHQIADDLGESNAGYDISTIAHENRPPYFVVVYYTKKINQ